MNGKEKNIMKLKSFINGKDSKVKMMDNTKKLISSLATKKQIYNMLHEANIKDGPYYLQKK